MRAVCEGVFAGPLALPKPAGGRPRSLALPCASQVRGLFPALDGEGLLFIVLCELGIAEGGRFCESSRCRGVIPDELGALLPRFMVGAL